jgi:hypothetical protein
LSTPVGGKVIAVLGDGSVRGELANGEVVEALCPAHVELAWLREALLVGPVRAIFAAPEGWDEPALWGIFPGREHEKVVADVTVRGRRVVVAAESIRLECEANSVKLASDGNVEIRGKDVFSRAKRINWVKGAAVRIN